MKLWKIASVAVIMLAGCAEHSRNMAYQACQVNWEDSGYEFRIKQTNNEYDYVCQVKVNGRWLPEDTVKDAVVIKL